ncbi:MAG TPA: glycosyltransferase family 39 protein [Chloroflexia bacterium]|jgi:4-amino-4-deoxy-L-arabinose transferase-like glycosyltransferase|nr:glycosyltransferase family 39 protein [Chloroflexia bacterium]
MQTSTAPVIAGTGPGKLLSVVLRHRRDLVNLGLIAGAFAILLLLVNPGRDYPTNDDWIYARSVQDLLAWNYRPPQWAQTVTISHVAWGALFAYFLGFSFTTLTLSTLVASLAGLGIFYLLLRLFDIGPSYALFGVALLGCNPMYVYLSYTFMTDITFVALMLASLLCFVTAFKQERVRDEWLLLGSVACALAYLDRQFGVLVCVSVLAYMWLRREWSWRRALMVVFLPMLAVVSFTFWERSQPVQLVSIALENATRGAMANPVGLLLTKLLTITYSVAMLGLCLLPLLFLRRPPRLSIVAFGLMAPFVVMLSTIEPAVLPIGNIIVSSGLITPLYSRPALVPEPVWWGLNMAGAFVLCLLIGSVFRATPAARRELEALRRRTAPGPIALVYILLGLLVPVTLVLPYSLFDRYLLPVLPLLIIVALRILQRASQSPAWWRWAALVPIALFSVGGMHDVSTLSRLRWHRAETLVSSGVAHRNINAGFEWIGWHLHAEGEKLVREKPLDAVSDMPGIVALDPVYLFSEVPRTGYEQIDDTTYRVWLAGGAERRIMLLRRTGTRR